ncbi:MAG: M20 family metallopeptidase [Kiritimatiellia bacterium]
MTMPDPSVNEVVELTRILVGIPSVNPLLADGDREISGEHRLVDYLESFLGTRGFACRRVEKTAGRPNLVATFGPDVPARRVMIEAHLDTQGIHGMTVSPFAAEIRENRLYGRGACDMKGPMAAALVNLTPDRLNKLAGAGVQILFVAAIGEETGNIGALELVEEGIAADEALVLEPTGLNIVHAHKGVLWLEVEVTGVAAHGSNPDKGISAIAGMSKLIGMLLRQTDGSRLFHDLLGRPTINIGMIQGGSSVNIVPERCVIKVDRRKIPGEEDERIVAKVRGGIERLVKDGQLAGGTVRVIKSGQPFATTADSALVRRLQVSAREHGVDAVCEGAAWYSDAGPFAQTCSEVAVFGPGSIKQAHTADEFIDIDQLKLGAEIIGTFLDKAASQA